MPVWTVQPEDHIGILESLENSFGELEKTDTLAGGLLNAAQNAVEDHLPDYLSELSAYTEGSLLEGLDELNLANTYQIAVRNSVGYLMLSRCGIDPRGYFTDEDFLEIAQFNTPQTLNALGVAAGDIGQMCLAEIARTVLSRQKEIHTLAKSRQTGYPVLEQKNTQRERSFEDERNYLHEEGRLQFAEPIAAPGTDDFPWEIRTDASTVSERTPEDHLHESFDQRQTEPLSGRNPADRPEPDGTGDTADDSGTGRDRGTEGSGSDGMGTENESDSEHSRGTDTGRIDLQLNEENAGVLETELPAFLDEKQIMAVIANKDDNLHYKKQQIELFFSVHSNGQERADYLKSAYPDRQTEITADGVRLGFQPQEDGLLMWEGSYPSRTKESIFSWDIVAQWTAQLIDKKKYFIQTDIGRLPTEEGQQMSLFAFRQSDDSTPIFPQLSQEVLDEALRIGANDSSSRLVICAHFMKDKPMEENSQFLREHYGENGAGFYLNDQKYSVWYNTEGFRVAKGERAAVPTATLLSWEQAAKRIRELLDLGRYLPQEELDRTADFERQELAAQLWYLRQDFAAETAGKGYLPTVNAIYNTHHGFPDESKAIYDLLGHSDQLQNLCNELEDFTKAYAQNRELLRFHYHQPKRILRRLTDLQREPLSFTTAEDFNPQRRFFISEDEIDHILRSDGSEYQQAVDSFYQNHTDSKERENFLKNYHGEYSGYHGGNDNVVYTHQKVTFSHGSITEPYAEVTLSWTQVEKRVSAMIAEGRFLDREDQTVQQPEQKQADNMKADTEKKPTIRELYEKYKPVVVSTVMEDVPYRNACMHSDRENAAIECSAAVSRAVLSSGNMELIRLYSDIQDFHQRLRREIFDETYPQMQDLSQEDIDSYSAELSDTEYAHQRLIPGETTFEMDGRTFLVDRINDESQTVNFQDITFMQAAGFPIFRVEPISVIRRHLEQENLVAEPDKTQEPEQPAFSTEQAAVYPREKTKLPYDIVVERLRVDKPQHKPVKSRRERIEFTVLYPEIPKEQRHDFHITDDALGHGTPTEKYTANIKAIRTLKQIESEERLATPEEQKVLSQYVGWGGLPQCFEETNSSYAELKSLLDENEFAAARASSLTAFYTSPVLIRGIYQALAQMGFQQGNILEPSCGVGNFLGMLPENMADSKFYGVELDSISGRIAQQLYQNAHISVNGFEKVQMPDSFFDVAVGNVPFGDFKVVDKRYDKYHWLIHDYFFGKTLDKVRPGGIVAFITSKGTMDKENSAVRKYLSQRADLIGAIRLPDNAFQQNAGTEVTSDILFLQKRERMTDLEPDWVHLDTDENGIRMNRYFVEHPEMILGRMVMESTRFGMDSACKAWEDKDLTSLLAEAVENLHAEILPYTRNEPDEEDRSIPADPAVKNFSYTVVDGTVYFRENSRMYPIQASVTAENRIRGMINLRECVRRLIDLQTENYPDEDIQKEQEKLNGIYDSFTKMYGLLNSRANRLAFSDDSSYCLLCSLEVLDEEGNLKRKADMFTQRTIRPHTAVTKVDTASEALAVSISEKACVDMEYMAKLSGKTPEELETELSGVIFRDIFCAENPQEIPAAHADLERYPLVTADEYLSGNVRRKLRMAMALYEAAPAEQKGQIKQNVDALQAVQLADLGAGEIGVRIGANWVPVEIYQQFMVELLETNHYAQSRIQILRSEATGQWTITEKSADRANVKAFTAYGTKRMNAYQILEQTLNQKDARVFDYIEDANGKRQAVLNKKETAIAQDRQELIKRKFAEWIWKDMDRRERLCKIYNETFNSIRPREYDGQHIRFEGMNPEKKLRPHQINAVAHILYGGNTLLAHEVGAGKTYEMIAAAMEMKRLGLCAKSLVVVPNHIIEQWAGEWLQLYPSANILVATKKDFETQNRKKFCSRIATGDYDAIIIGHSQFEKIPMSAERQQAILQQQIDEIMFGIQEAKSAKAERYTIKQLERTRKSLEAKLEKLNDQSRKDDVVVFEELGVDRIFVDESHYFKNLFLATKMQNVGGIAQTEAQKSSDLFMKCRYLDEITGGRGVIFATGTPISNSMVEMYTIQRYLQYSSLQEMGLIHFDDWASNFGETVTAIELSPEGSGYRAKTRFAKFYNLPELMSVFKQIADVQTADMLKLPVPKANFHTEVIRPSELQKEMVKGLAKRAEKVRNRQVEPNVDNMLKITNDGRKLALDMRLINPLAADDPNGKVSVCAQNVFGIWEQHKEKRSTQLVFCDLSTPKGDGSFNVYDDLKKKLMDKGIPEEEIAFIHHADTEVKKKELFARVRSGQVRVLMGSTQKMGAGTNVQDRLIALHDLDCPWRPSDLQQRLGRIVRQFNQNPEVEIYRYVTENTFDAYLYQLVENKQKFIAQIMTSKSPVRVADDVDETALNYAEIKALATGNPLIIEKCNLDMEVGKLNLLKADYLNQRYALEKLVERTYPAEIAQLTERIAGYEQDAALAESHPKVPEGFCGMEVEGKHYTQKEDAGKAIIDVCAKLTGSDAVLLGQYRGFSMALAYDGINNEYRITLKGTLSHTVTLGTDIFGNITRLDNALDKLPESLQMKRTELADTKVQLENARAELEKPFSNEAELAEKTERLNELNILLNMDQKDKVLLDAEPDEGTEPQERKAVGLER